ncbi:hypothetical protein BDQ17DRAFT_1393312 [Cyathus striatus]|nr:hypothetical protein BDQ17DRAFT_1393312 [Cyathus striatus]
MEPRQYSCFACRTHSITQSGYEKHIRLSQDAFCRQYRNLEAQKQAWTQNAEHEKISGSQATSFAGDAFGTAAQYDNDTFGQDEAGDFIVTSIDGGSGTDEIVDEEDPDEIEAEAATAVTEFDWKPPGAVLRQSDYLDEVYQRSITNSSNSWAPFTSRLDWEVAKWAKCRGPSSTAFTELLAIDGFQDAINLSYKNTVELNKIIDMKLPGCRPKFQRREVLVAGQSFELYSRNILECVCVLWGDSKFTPHLILEPQRQFVDEDHNVRQYHDMHTAKWWWSTQVEEQLKRMDCTIVPILISSDKTQLTTFRNKTAYPVYMTIVLLGYLPTSKLDHIKNKASRRRTLAKLFHACMDFILQPLQEASRSRIELVSSDGAVRQCYPIFAAYIGDYPEQVMVTLIKTGRCPSCPAPCEGIGEMPETLSLPPQDDTCIRSALETVSQGSTDFNKACEEVGIKLIPHPFWKNLPFVNIYQSITPDILHQLFQGVVKHVIAWVRSAIGDAEIDARCRRFPPNHHIRVFMKGVCNLSRVTGTEHDQISRFLLGLILGQLVTVVRALLDFVQLARYPQIFIDLGIRTQFNIIKLHYTQHYRLFIELFGTTDNTDTQYTERLHIDLAKDAYNATNGKDEFSQMTLWLECKERVFRHDKFIWHQLFSVPVLQAYRPSLMPPLVPCRLLRMTKHPSCRAVTFSVLQEEYGALDFQAALARMVFQYQHPEISDPRQIRQGSRSLAMLCQSVSVYHRIKFVSRDPFSANPAVENVVDSIHVQPSRIALVDFDDGGALGVEGMCHTVAQIRCVFSLPTRVCDEWFKGPTPSKHFAYVEWFTPFSAAELNPASHMYKISRLRIAGELMSSVIAIDLIKASIHLFPHFGPKAPESWMSSNVLEECDKFYVNPFNDRFQYAKVV